MLFLKKKYYCPVCNSNPDTYVPLPPFYKENAKQHGYKYFGTGEMTALKTYSCKNCGSSDRERLYAYYMKMNFRGDESINFYHFAPELSLGKFIKNYFNNCNYKTYDLISNNVDVHADLTDLNMIEDNECDFFICSHVLEHIQNDRSAMAELFRITKPGGSGILMAPISIEIKKSIENIPGVSTDSDRWHYYGQNDHVRLYSKEDFLQRIYDSGFKVEQIDRKIIGKDMIQQLGLKKTSVLYVVRKEK